MELHPFTFSIDKDDSTNFLPRRAAFPHPSTSLVPLKRPRSPQQNTNTIRRIRLKLNEQVASSTSTNGPLALKALGRELYDQSKVRERPTWSHSIITARKARPSDKTEGLSSDHAGPTSAQSRVIAESGSLWSPNEQELPHPRHVNESTLTRRPVPVPPNEVSKPPVPPPKLKLNVGLNEEGPSEAAKTLGRAINHRLDSLPEPLVANDSPKSRSSSPMSLCSVEEVVIKCSSEPFEESRDRDNASSDSQSDVFSICSTPPEPCIELQSGNQTSGFSKPHLCALSEAPKRDGRSILLDKSEDVPSPIPGIDHDFEIIWERLRPTKQDVDKVSLELHLHTEISSEIPAHTPSSSEQRTSNPAPCPPTSDARATAVAAAPSPIISSSPSTGRVLSNSLGLTIVLPFDIVTPSSAHSRNLDALPTPIEDDEEIPSVIAYGTRDVIVDSSSLDDNNSLFDGELSEAADPVPVSPITARDIGLGRSINSRQLLTPSSLSPPPLQRSSVRVYSRHSIAPMRLPDDIRDDIYDEELKAQELTPSNNALSARLRREIKTIKAGSLSGRVQQGAPAMPTSSAPGLDAVMKNAAYALQYREKATKVAELEAV